MSLEHGKFIVLEGLDGSGKTTQAKMLAEALQTLGYDVVLTREPGGTEWTKKIRELILDEKYEKQNPWTQAFLFFADRAEHVPGEIRQGLQRGAIVICDRFSASTIAFQGFGENLSLSDLRRMNELATGGLLPDLTIIIDVSVAKARSRTGKRPDGNNFYDQHPIEFHKEVRRGYLWQAKSAHNPKPVVVIEGADSPEEVHLLVLGALKDYGILTEEVGRSVTTRSGI